MLPWCDLCNLEELPDLAILNCLIKCIQIPQPHCFLCMPAVSPTLWCLSLFQFACVSQQFSYSVLDAAFISWNLTWNFSKHFSPEEKVSLRTVSLMSLMVNKWRVLIKFILTVILFNTTVSRKQKGASTLCLCSDITTSLFVTICHMQGFQLAIMASKVIKSHLVTSKSLSSCLPLNPCALFPCFPPPLTLLVTCAHSASQLRQQTGPLWPVFTQLTSCPSDILHCVEGWPS